MKILNIILFIGLGLITASCGVGKKDGRLVLHSESEESVTITGDVISKIRLGQAIASQVDSVSEVYDINKTAHWFWGDGIVFSVKATSGKVYTGLSCSADYDAITEEGNVIVRILFRDCGNEQVKFAKTLKIRVPDVLSISDDNRRLMH